MAVSAAEIAHRSITYHIKRTPRIYRQKVQIFLSTRELNIEVHPDAESLSRRAADMIVDQAATGKGTVLTPGCNTPMGMYRALGPTAYARNVNLPALLKGQEGDFRMGMIDGTEWPLEHPLSFRYYFAQYFLRFMGMPSLCAMRDPAQKKEVIEFAYRMLKNVYVPWMPREANEAEKMKYVYEFNQWLVERLPIHLIFCGIGPDGHIAFLGKGQEHIKLFASRVKLWPEIQEWKWANRNDESCICTREGSCGTKVEIPEHALTISLGTFLDARHVVLMALGEAKAEAIRKFILDPYDPQNFVAQYLRDAVGEVTVLLDEKAAVQL